jgi:hypothetical protein
LYPDATNRNENITKMYRLREKIVEYLYGARDENKINVPENDARFLLVVPNGQIFFDLPSP